MFYSPLRYPGGKNRLSKFISQICIDNNIDGHYVEPFAGGASVALFLLMEGRVKKITINDYDRSVYAFWYSVLNYTDKLCNLIKDTEINLESWAIQKKIQNNKKKHPLLKLGFSTLFLNRTNFSGILNGGPLGGFEQRGDYKLDCRFNKEDIIMKIKDIAKYKEKIKLYNLDALELIEKIKKKSDNVSTIFYFDPPYYLKGSCLYLNSYDDVDHKLLSEAIKTIRNAAWVVSYDNTEEINKLYSWVEQSAYFNLKHFVNHVKDGKEVLFFRDSLNIDRVTGLP